MPILSFDVPAGFLAELRAAMRVHGYEQGDVEPNPAYIKRITQLYWRGMVTTSRAQTAQQTAVPVTDGDVGT